MIDYLYTTAITDKSDNCYGTRLPSDNQIFEKLNEVITLVNDLEKKVNKLTQ